MRLGLAIACAFITACGTPVLHLLPDPKSYAVTSQVSEAINAAAGRTLVSLDSPQERTVVIRSACGAYTGGTILAGPCGGPPDPLVLMHEIGHAFGLGHSSNSQSIMAPRLRRVSLEDAARSLVIELGE